ncbi:MAG: hypothetical protein CFE29_03595 [Bradyrhizobiaceae bacterium PARB1]|jgi:hypothetical protein|nr:MAG: hypothetical protein CFE29_03595 [Bradyrhizobiaceae bacterium PARB1]
MTQAVERFVIRAGHEWAFIYVDEAHGVFTSYGSFGNYNYSWGSIGDRTLKQFLAGLNFDYFMGKTRRDYLRFDAEASVKGIKEHILEARRVGDISKDEARQAWREADDLEHHQSADSFYSYLCQSEEIMDLYGGDYCDIARERPDGDSRGFWQKIWPEFLKQASALTGNQETDGAA